MGEAQQQHPKIASELALLLVLATLWGASYTFLKIAVATIPPVTLIAGRTLIAGLLLVVIMRWRGISIAGGCRELAALPVPGLPQQRHSLDDGRLGHAGAGCRCRHHPQFDGADIHVFPDLRHHPPRGGDVPKAVRRRRGDGGHLPDRRHAGAGGTGRAIGGADRHCCWPPSATRARRSSAAPSRISIRWRRRRDRCSAAPRS